MTKPLEEIIKESEELLDRLHENVWQKRGFNGVEYGFNEKGFYEFARGVEMVGEKLPGVYAKYIYYVDLYYSNFIKYS